MPNGEMTDHDYLIQIHTHMGTIKEWLEKVEKKLDKHLEGGNCSPQREITEHKKNIQGTINTMWLFIIALPALIGIIITLIKVLG